MAGTDGGVSELPLDPKTQFMNLLWELAAKVFRAADGREVPRIMYEELEGVLEAIYEAGQDSQVEYGQRVQEADALGGNARPGRRVGFSEWWNTEDGKSPRAERARRS